MIRCPAGHWFNGPVVLVARSEGRLRELAGELAAEYGAEAQVVPR
jgi:short-subunit dehydrogenase